MEFKGGTDEVQVPAQTEAQAQVKGAPTCFRCILASVKACLSV